MPSSPSNSRSVTDQEGRTTQYRYDALGQLTGVKDAKMQWTEYGYDEAGRMVWMEDALDRRTQYEYDRAGRRTNVILPLMQRSTTVYDAVGNVDYSIDFNGEKTDYTYDAQNRLTLKSFVQDGTAIAYTYTTVGLVETITDSRGVTSFRYDGRDRLISRKDPTGAYTANGYSIEYGYDAVGNRTRLITPGGMVNYSFDERNRLEQVRDGADTTTYTYDGVNNLIKTLRPNGVEEIREYNSVYQLELLKNVKRDGNGAEVILTSYDYVLDKVGHRLSATEKVQGQSDRLVNYDYDELYRLEQEQVRQNGTVTRTTNFTYDAVGNRLSQKVTQGGVMTETTYQYDNNDRLEWEKVNGVTSVTYHYDANGNTTQKTEVGKGTTTYSWNQDGRLTDVLTADGQAIAYTYDSEGIRTSSTVDGTTTTYLLDKNRDYAQVLEEFVNGQLQTSYVYGLDLISQERGSQTAFYLVDGLGSTTALTGSNGELTDSYTYQAFGEIEGRSGSTENTYLFAGEQFDEGVGEYYLRQRYYSANTGRFTRRDTYEGSIYGPLTLHKYLYAHDNPINFTDPTGLFTMGDISAANTIREILAGIQLNTGGYLVSATLNDGDYGLKEFIVDTAWNAAFAFIPHAVSYLARRAFRGSTAATSPLGARGPLSGREFDPSNAGGAIKKLSMRNVKITHRGIDKLTEHVRRFDYDPGNEYMIERLRSIADGKLAPTQVDLNYYTHELREGFRYKKLGIPRGQQPLNEAAARTIWNNAHTATLEEYAVREADLLHPEAIKRSEDYLRKLYGF